MRDVSARRPSSAAYKTENVLCETGLYSYTQNGTNTETLEQQYEVVKEETAHSHVSKYGDMVSMRRERRRRGGRERGKRDSIAKSQ